MSENEWGDRPDEWTHLINAAHPTRRADTGEEYATAMRMVGNRHSKHALVSLVCWLLVQLKDKTRELVASFCANPAAPRRLRVCVENWPECVEGTYDPRCCRFPKSCSCTVYDPKHVREVDLEPRK